MGKVVEDEVMVGVQSIVPCQPLKVLWGLGMRQGDTGEG